MQMATKADKAGADSAPTPASKARPKPVKCDCGNRIGRHELLTRNGTQGH